LTVVTPFVRVALMNGNVVPMSAEEPGLPPQPASKLAALASVAS